MPGSKDHNHNNGITRGACAMKVDRHCIININNNNTVTQSGRCFIGLQKMGNCSVCWHR